jgi:magnesium transporter
MLRLFKIEDGLIKELSQDTGDVSVDIAAAADWVDVHDPDESERALMHALLDTDIPDTPDVEEIEASARDFVDQSGIHVHSLYLVPSEGRYSTVTVACILQANRLITIRESEVADFRLLRMRARRGQLACHNPAELLVTLLDQKVENHADNLEDIHRELEAATHLILEEKNTNLEEATSELAKLEDDNGKMRLCLMDTQRDISFLLKHLRHDAELTETLREIMRDIETLMSHAHFLFDKTKFLMDSTQGFINIQQNQIIKTFSIAAVVFLPPTLVASIYGMNFKFMPELAWMLGYPWAVGLMILSSIAPYWYFKRKGWL